MSFHSNCLPLIDNAFDDFGCVVSRECHNPVRQDDHRDSLGDGERCVLEKTACIRVHLFQEFFRCSIRKTDQRDLDVRANAPKAFRVQDPKVSPSVESSPIPSRSVNDTIEAALLTRRQGNVRLQLQNWPGGQEPHLVPSARMCIMGAAPVAAFVKVRRFGLVTHFPGQGEVPFSLDTVAATAEREPEIEGAVGVAAFDATLIGVARAGLITEIIPKHVPQHDRGAEDTSLYQRDQHIPCLASSSSLTQPDGAFNAEFVGMPLPRLLSPWHPLTPGALIHRLSALLVSPPRFHRGQIEQCATFAGIDRDPQHLGGPVQVARLDEDITQLPIRQRVAFGDRLQQFQRPHEILLLKLKRSQVHQRVGVTWQQLQRLFIIRTCRGILAEAIVAQPTVHVVLSAKLSHVRICRYRAFEILQLEPDHSEIRPDRIFVTRLRSMDQELFGLREVTAFIGKLGLFEKVIHRVIHVILHITAGTTRVFASNTIRFSEDDRTKCNHSCSIGVDARDPTKTYDALEGQAPHRRAIRQREPLVASRPRALPDSHLRELLSPGPQPARPVIVRGSREL